MRLTIGIIGLLAALAVLAATGTAGRHDTTAMGTDRMLTQREMAQSFGKGCPCTLGQDEQVKDCLEGQCWTCINLDMCLSKDYPEGNYIYTCKNTGITDGSCYQGDLIDCKRRYACDINGIWYSDRNCRNVLTGFCQTPASYYGCCNCVKGDPEGPVQQQRNWFCACP
jgi:hypothetical protein